MDFEKNQQTTKTHEILPSRQRVKTHGILILYVTGTWYVILTFMNFCGVISNAFLIAYTSAWGDAYDENGKLWIVIFFEVRLSSYLTVCILMDFSIQIDTTRMVLSILYFKGSQIRISNYDVFLAHRIRQHPR